MEKHLRVWSPPESATVLLCRDLRVLLWGAYAMGTAKTPLSAA